MFQPLQSRCYGFGERTKLYNVAKGDNQEITTYGLAPTKSTRTGCCLWDNVSSDDNIDFVQRLKLQSKLEVHTGCVNTICWNDRGTQILSGSDDQHLVFTDPFTTKKILSIRSGHRANIFSAKYLPNTGDKQVVSCSGDGKIYYTDVERTDNLDANLFDCHFGTTYEVIVIPSESSTFLSCGEDGTVRWFDLRVKSSCFKEDCKDDVLINCRRAVTSLAVNPVLPYQLGIACSDSSVRIYDRRMLGTRASGNYTGRGINGMLSRFTAPSVANRSYRITSLNYSPNGNDVLVSYSSEYIYLFGTKDNKVKSLETKVTGQPKKSNGLKQSSDPVTPASTSVKNLQQNTKSSTKQMDSPKEETKSDQKAVLKFSESKQSAAAKQTPTPSVDPEPSVSVDQEPSTSVSQEPSTSVSQEPSTSVSQEPSASVNQEPSTSVNQEPSASVNQEPSTSVSQEPSASVNQEPSTSVESVPSTSVGATPSISSPSFSVDAATPSEREDVASSSGGATGTTQSTDTRQPPVKRLRLRGDWSDTGPNARPESERQSDDTVPERRNPHTSLMQRMSDMLTRWLDGNLLRNNEGGDRSAAEGGGTGNQTNEPPEPVLPQDAAAGENPEPVEMTMDTGEHPANSDQTAAVTSSDNATESKSVTSPGKDNTNSSDRNVTSTKEECTAGQSSEGLLSDNNDVESPCEVVKPAEYNALSPSDTRDTTISHSDAHSLSVQLSDDSADNSPNSSLYTPDSIPETQDERSNSSISGQSNHPESLSPHLSESHSPDSESLSQLEPVISLHYSTQGTSSSTVRLGFARFENLEAGILQRSAENASLEPFVRETTHQQQQLQQEQNLSEDLTVRSEQTEESSPSMDTEESVESPNSTVDNMCVEMTDSSESNNDHLTCKSDNQDDNTMDTDTLCTDTVSSSESLCQTETDKSSSSKSKSRIPRPVKNQTKTSANSSCNIEETESTSKENHSDSVKGNEVGGNENEREACGSYTKEAPTEQESGTENDQTKATTDGSASSSHGGATSSLNSGSTHVEAERSSSQQGTDSAPSGARQRRIGRSGPPTGNFQLSLNDDSSDNESGEGTPRRNRDTHHTLERHVNAIRLQELYRKRQEEKEKEEMEMKNIHQPGVRMKYKGHRNARTMIKEANFWGDNFVMSGSDCGHIFIWDTFTAKLVMLLEADRHVVNCLQPHPFDPILASSGIDYDVKIWTPLEEQPCFESEAAEEIMRRNEVMLEETRDTITVPAAFMLRVLASLNQIRSGRATSNRESREENDSSSDSE